jgi:dolichol-phosphate mannosyltransferase
LTDSLVIIPTYNEKENIMAILNAVINLGDHFDVLVVDDGSPDGTADLVRKQMLVFPGRIHILERKGKSGLGTAYIAGFLWALDKEYTFICEMDADFSHPPADLLRLRSACLHEGADVAVGSRYTKGGKVKNWPFDRIFISYGASLYVRLLTGMSVKDPTAGFVCYQRNVLATIDLNKIKFVGYAFQIEMKFASFHSGFIIKEIPITFVDRTLGTSKMSGSIIKEAVLGVLEMRWRSFFNTYKRDL